MPKFSIIIPVYNVEKYLRESLNSIANQTLTEFEVICINDGSTDNSLSLLEEYAQKDARFKIISQENQGQGVARNKGLKIAEGEYIVFLDPDDWLETNALEEIYTYFKQTKADVIEFNYKEYNDYSGKFRFINLANRIKKTYNYDLCQKKYYSWKDVKKGCLYKLELHVWARAYSKKFLDNINARFAPTKHGEDHLFAHIVLLNANKIYYLDQYLYNYRCRKDSAVNSISDNNFGIFQNVELTKNYLIKNNFYEELEKEFKDYQIMAMSWHCKNVPSDMLEEYHSKCLKYLTPKEYKKMLNEVKYKHTSLLEFIFSLKNEQEFGIKRKVITILGIRIKIKPKPKKVEVQ